jgi:hypothetical protein
MLDMSNLVIIAGLRPEVIEESLDFHTNDPGLLQSLLKIPLTLPFSKGDEVILLNIFHFQPVRLSPFRKGGIRGILD